jgi:transcriptional regulator
LQVHDDVAWIRAQVGALTTRHEAVLPQPWAVDDAPSDYVQTMLGQIVGIEIAIASITGKWKVSQNQPARNRAGAIEGLCALGADIAGDPGNAVAMAELIRGHESEKK